MSFVSYYSDNKYSNILQSTKWKPYLPLYDEHTKDLKHKPGCKILEIGVRHGGSLLSYLTIFNKPVIFGIDINEKCKLLERYYNFNIFIGNESDTVFLKGVKNKCVDLDIVIDDGSHILDNIYVSFKELFPILNNNGVYIIEDIHDDYINTDILLNGIQHVKKVIKYDNICFIFKDSSVNDTPEIIDKLNTITYNENDRIHIGTKILKGFVPGYNK